MVIQGQQDYTLSCICNPTSTAGGKTTFQVLNTHMYTHIFQNVQPKGLFIHVQLDRQERDHA